jgi:hypothetical protein
MGRRSGAGMLTVPKRGAGRRIVHVEKKYGNLTREEVENGQGKKLEIVRPLTNKTQSHRA